MKFDICSLHCNISVELSFGMKRTNILLVKLKLKWNFLSFFSKIPFRIKSPYMIKHRAIEGIFSLLHRLQSGAGAHPASYPMRIGGSFLGVKRPGRDADNLTSI
jgi:hypothetical protein